MRDIQLLVLDECHQAMGSHPYAQIMQDFYWPALQADGETGVPKVC
jgi:ERCC4-related helicase